jgi:hypothetical protein
MSKWYYGSDWIWCWIIFGGILFKSIYVQANTFLSSFKSSISWFVTTNSSVELTFTCCTFSLVPKLILVNCSSSIIVQPTMVGSYICSWVGVWAIIISPTSGWKKRKGNTRRNLVLCNKKIMTKCPKQLIIDCNNKGLLQILHVKSCSHILMVHLTNRWWHGNMKVDVIFSLQVVIHMASTINDKMTLMSKISYENVIMIKSFQIYN